VDNNGTLTYTLAARAPGTSTFTVRVQDSGGTANGGTDTSAPQTFTLVVRDSEPPALTSPGDQTNNEGDAVSLALAPLDADPGSFAASGLPRGLSIDTGTGVISGTIDPRAAGSYVVTVTALDCSVKSSIQFAWVVKDTTPPALTNPGPQQFQAGS